MNYQRKSLSILDCTQTGQNNITKHYKLWFSNLHINTTTKLFVEA